MKAIEAMQGSSAGGRRLLVKIVSFGWTKRRNKLDKGMTKRIPKSNKLMPMHRPEAYNQSGGGREEKTSNKFSVHKEMQLYDDAVKGHEMKRNIENIKVGREVIAVNSKWITNSVVRTGKSKMGRSHTMACVKLQRITRLGGGKVLMSFSNLEEANQAIKEL